MEISSFSHTLAKLGVDWQTVGDYESTQLGEDLVAIGHDGAAQALADRRADLYRLGDEVGLTQRPEGELLQSALEAQAFEGDGAAQRLLVASLLEERAVPDVSEPGPRLRPSQISELGL